MGWASTQNGELLKLAAAEGFVALLSADKNMEYQQSSTELTIAVIVLAPVMNRLVDLIPLIPSVIDLLEVEHVTCPMPIRGAIHATSLDAAILTAEMPAVVTK